MAQGRVIPLGAEIARPEPLDATEIAELRARMVRALRRICPPHLADAAEDLAQDALMRILALLKKIDPGEGKARLTPSYVSSVAYSVMIDEIRRRRGTRDVQPVPDAPDLRSPSPEQRALAHETVAHLRSCMGRLVEARRLAVTLYLQGHSVPEAAVILGWSEKRTENLVYRGLADLRQCLAAKGSEP